MLLHSDFVDPAVDVVSSSDNIASVHPSTFACSTLALFFTLIGTLACDRAADAIPLPNITKPKADTADELFKRSRPLMGTIFVMHVDAPEETARPAVQAAFDEIERLEEALSEWKPTSEISRINAAAGKRAIQVSDDVYTVIKAGLDVSRWSGGAFDLSWAALRGMYDFSPGSFKHPSKRSLNSKLSLINWRRIKIDDERKTVFLTKRHMAIGTGGIAKGYALDRAGVILRTHGVQNYMLFGGGQVQVHGKRSDRAWRVGVQHPREPSAYFGALESSGASFSTSGDYEHAFIDDRGKRWHHILDTKTGLPAEKTMSVTVMARSGIHADALSTAAFVLGPKRAKKMFARLPMRADLVIVGRDCVLTATDTAVKLLKPNADLDTVDIGKPLPQCSPEN